MKNLIKKIIPANLFKFLRPLYHGCVAYIASWYFGRPSLKLKVVGVTGTAGKSTTVQILAHILNNTNKQEGGDKYKCGFVTTVSFFDGDNELINRHGLSMPGGWLLQKQLKQIVENGCQFAVVECTSEGLMQNRHLGIKFDVVVLTNLSQAHLEAHGGFLGYRSAKGKLFSALSPRGMQISLVNSDDENAEWFLGFEAKHKIAAGFNKFVSEKPVAVYNAKQISGGFVLNDVNFEVKLPGEFNLYNALLAVVAAHKLGVGLEFSSKVLSNFIGIRGRMEEVKNEKGFKIFVDYGCEPVSIRAALGAVNAMPHNRIIHVFGSTGGHRDIQKRFLFGQISAQLADVIVITNDDVYESDPEKIAEDIEEGVRQVNGDALKAKQVIKHLDRRYAITDAIKMAKANDILLITGKGSEQFLILPGNKRVEWDDVVVVKDVLKNTEII
ncbi:MAG: UDP-N-acetylmuramyl-tripeptide synthetase [Candidatus Doudnabacteria bacterium]|nr:UDP-N-acetylmuramyl-tripeptide synthetase [Candidatus Doudnabacteria bacterium]